MALSSLPAQNFYKGDGDFPVAWAKEYGRGRVFYSSFTHYMEGFDRTDVQRMYLEAIKWAMGITPGVCDSASPAQGVSLVLGIDQAIVTVKTSSYYSSCLPVGRGKMKMILMRVRQLIWLSAIPAVVALSTATAPAQSDLPEGKAKDTVVMVCTACHAPDLFMAARMTHSGWSELVDEDGGRRARTARTNSLRPLWIT